MCIFPASQPLHLERGSGSSVVNLNSGFPKGLPFEHLTVHLTFMIRARVQIKQDTRASDITPFGPGCAQWSSKAVLEMTQSRDKT